MVFCILLTAACFNSGCIFPAEHSIPAINQSPALSPGSQINYGGTALAVAF